MVMMMVMMMCDDDNDGDDDGCYSMQYGCFFTTFNILRNLWLHKSTGNLKYYKASGHEQYLPVHFICPHVRGEVGWAEKGSPFGLNSGRGALGSVGVQKRLVRLRFVGRAHVEDAEQCGRGGSQDVAFLFFLSGHPFLTDLVHLHTVTPVESLLKRNYRPTLQRFSMQSCCGKPRFTNYRANHFNSWCPVPHHKTQNCTQSWTVQYSVICFNRYSLKDMEDSCSHSFHMYK